MCRFIVLLLITRTVWAQNGLDKLVPVLDYENLSIKDKAIYDAKKDARKWIFFPPTAVMTLAASSGSYFIETGHHPLESFTAAFISGLGLFSSYFLFNQKTDEKNIENMSPDELSIYQSAYLREYVKRKNKNVLKSSLVIGIVGGLGAYMVVSSI